MTDDLSAARHQMVETQIKRRGFQDPRLLAAFEEVPRHLFVPPTVQHLAYEDMPLPIGHDQTISQPYIVAVMTDLLQLTGDERVLEIGTGSGYEAAVLSRLAAQVHTVELVPELGEHAERVLHELGFANVHIHIGDGSLGWPETEPYAGIIAAAAAPEVPRPLLEQLQDGAHLVLPVADDHEQLLKIYTRRQNEFTERVVMPVAFVPLHGKHGWH